MVRNTLPRKYTIFRIFLKTVPQFFVLVTGSSVKAGKQEPQEFYT